MGMQFSVYSGSGRATCSACNKKIKKDEFQMHATSGSGSYTHTGNAHVSCIMKMFLAVIKDNAKKKGGK